MLAIVSVVGVMLGAATAYASSRYPSHVEVLETVAGALLIGGLALLGTALPAVL